MSDNDYCDPHDDDQYAIDDDREDMPDEDWGVVGQENVPESVEEREKRVEAQRERVCRNCENYDTHCDISFCRRFWQYEAYLTVMSKDVSEKRGRAKDCKFYKNKYE
jgi:hypothetical protein